MIGITMKKCNISSVPFAVLVATLCGLILATAVANVQVGRRFPLGVQLGDAAVEDCTENTTGLLRFFEGEVQVCRDGSFLPVGSNETLQVNHELLQLREMIDELNQTRQSDLSNDEVKHLRQLYSLEMCNRRGFFSVENRRCECDCTLSLGCFDSASDCSSCMSGWTGSDCRTDTVAPVIVLTGGNVLSWELGVTYADPGAQATDNADGDISSLLVVSVNTVDENTLGQYSYGYSVTDQSGNSASATRTVHVIDMTPPTIALIGASAITIEAAVELPTLPGVTVTDNLDSPETLVITSNETSVDSTVVGVHVVSYYATDSSGNNSPTVYRTVEVIDTTAPVLVLVGSDTVTHTTDNDEYVDQGVTIIEASSGHVTLSNTTDVNATVIGNYTITYDAVDASGNAAQSVTRNIHVRDRILRTSCDHYASEQRENGNVSTLTPGEYTIDVVTGYDGNTPIVVQEQWYCMFVNGFGYDLLFNLDSSDDVRRNYDDTTFWESTTEFGNVASALSAEYKGNAFHSARSHREWMVYVHDGAGTAAGFARYVIRGEYNNMTALEMMSSLSQETISFTRPDNAQYASGTTGVTSTCNHEGGGLGPGLYGDLFLDFANALVINRLSGFHAELTNIRVSTDLIDIHDDIFTWGHVIAGLGGNHLNYGGCSSSGCAFSYESAPLQCYCTFQYLYGTLSDFESGTGSGNMEQTPTNGVDFCGGDTPTFLPWNTAVFSRSLQSDGVAPSVSLIGAATVTIEANSSYTDAGVSAIDNVDEPEVLSVVISGDDFDRRDVGSHTISYTVSDLAGNTAPTVTRTVVVVDTTPPVLTLNGPSTVEHLMGEAYVDEGVVATDNANGAVVTQVVSTVDVNTVGEYTVTYTGTDASGNVAIPVVRTVVVDDDPWITSCEELYEKSANPTLLTDGEYTLNFPGDVSRQTYCRFQDGHGYDLLFTLDTDDDEARTYTDTAFWTTGSTHGSASSALTAEFKSAQFESLSSIEDLMVVVHDGSGNRANDIGFSRYSLLPSFYQLSLLDMMQTLSDATISTPLNTGNSAFHSVIPASVGVTSSCVHSGGGGSTGHYGDVFLDFSHPLVINKDGGFGADLTKIRFGTTLPTAETALTWGHILGGIGNQHRHTGGCGPSGCYMEAEYVPLNCYCSFSFTYGSRSDYDAGVLSGNIYQGGEPSGSAGNAFTLCGGTAATTFINLDVSVYARGRTIDLD